MLSWGGVGTCSLICVDLGVLPFLPPPSWSLGGNWLGQLHPGLQGQVQRLAVASAPAMCHVLHACLKGTDLLVPHCKC